MRRLVLFAVAFCSPALSAANEIEREPILYDSAPADNALSRLAERLENNPDLLKADDLRSFLPLLLKELKVPESSQTLVFSRTSLQRTKIRPDRPRAIFFSDDVYVGVCQNSDLLEFSAVDAKLGAVFYSADFTPGKPPVFNRQNDSCMLCHGSSANSGHPGHLVRSVFPDGDGNPLLSLGTSRVDQRTPIKLRWGGWYVTGSTGKQSHLGNRIFSGPIDRDRVKPEFLNRAAIDDLIDQRRYLHGHSDVVALMVLEHQAEMQNLLTRANFQTRIGLHQDAELNAELRRPAKEMSDSTWRRIQSVGDQAVRYLLFADEAPISDAISGSSSFARDFESVGKRDSKGRSLRDLDLKTRLFKYPCSYLIHSEQFAGLPAEVKDYILQRLHAVLTGKDTRAVFEHLTPDDRQAILEILRETEPKLTAGW